MDYIFNHDGFSLLAELADTDRTPEDADRLLVAPLAEAGFTVIDWCIISTWIHNCRTRRGRGADRPLLEKLAAAREGMWRDREETIFSIGDVVAHYNAQERDLLDCVIDAAHRRGMRVFGNVRLNHAMSPEWIEGVPGPSHKDGIRKDFRDDDVHDYLVSIYEDFVAKGVDGVTLEFERKAPFFPEEAPPQERFAACRRFVEKVRSAIDKPLAARVCYRPDQGEPQGQKPLEWMAAGLLDAVIPATHNHKPDTLDWPIAPFVEAAKATPRPCAVWPQIWPVGGKWSEQAQRHGVEAVHRRARELAQMGADGVYLFNFCCYGPDLGAVTGDFTAIGAR